jgi:hypothetical protein
MCPPGERQATQTERGVVLSDRSSNTPAKSTHIQSQENEVHTLASTCVASLLCRVQEQPSPHRHLSSPVLDKLSAHTSVTSDSRIYHTKRDVVAARSLLFLEVEAEGPAFGRYKLLRLQRNIWLPCMHEIGMCQRNTTTEPFKACLYAHMLTTDGFKGSQTRFPDTSGPRLANRQSSVPVCCAFTRS